ncbi:3977_t:CDS:2, partial [Ambispora gerdemannii]
MVSCTTNMVKSLFYQKSQTDELEYSSVQDWSPEEVNLFLRNKFAEDWEALKEFGFEKYKVTGSTLLELKADDLRKSGLPFLVAKELENTVKQLSGKTIYVQAYDDEGELLEKFEEYTMHSENDLHTFLKRVDGKGLESIDDNNEVPKVVTSLKYIRPNQYYRINASHLTAVKKQVVWSKVEDQAMEEETLLAVHNALTEKIKAPTKIFPKRKHIFKLIGRLKEFPKKLEATTDLEFKQLLGKQHIGVACGTKFSEELRRVARDELGLIVIFPGGGRYKEEEHYHEELRLRQDTLDITNKNLDSVISDDFWLYHGEITFQRYLRRFGLKSLSSDSDKRFFETERLYDTLSIVLPNEALTAWAIRVQELISRSKFSVYHKHCLYASFPGGKFEDYNHYRPKQFKNGTMICLNCVKLVRVNVNAKPRKVIQNGCDIRKGQSSATQVWHTVKDDNTPNDEKYL